MSAYAFEVTTALSPDESFAYVSDLRNTVEFIDAVEEVNLLDDSPPADHVGARYEVIVDRLVGEAVMQYEVTELDGPRRIQTRLEHRVVTGHESWDIEPTPDGGSRLRYTTDYQLRGVGKLAAPFAPLLMRLSGKDVQKHLAGRLDALAGGPSAA